VSVAAKICGLSTVEAVRTAVRGGAQYLGFVFFPKSPRNVSPEQAAALCAAEVPSGIQRVGLFVDADDETIARILAVAPIDILQFHGKESPDRVVEAKLRHKRPVMKAISIAGPEDVLGARVYEDVADILLFDAKPPRLPQALPGGNGLAFDWQLLGGKTWSRPWMLSGGLTPENLAEAVATTHAPAVDVSSGVERAPGEKDPSRIAAFLAEARRL
jgi:phosphoribosylanthranilate isomerase